jgi:hypothetical protein
VGLGAEILFILLLGLWYWGRSGCTAITRGLAAFIGAAEIAGGLGIVLPMPANIAPSLSLWAAACPTGANK